MKQRRVRVKKEAVIMSPTEKKKLSALLDEFIDNEDEIARRVARNKAMLAEVDTNLRTIGLREFQTAISTAGYEIPATRTTTIIDPVKFREMVNDADFISSITVGVTKAKKVVSERELESVSTKFTPNPKDPVLKIKKRK